MKNSGRASKQTEWKTVPLAKVQLVWVYRKQTLETSVVASLLYTKCGMIISSGLPELFTFRYCT